jgi:hypothetical protein
LWGFEVFFNLYIFYFIHIHEFICIYMSVFESGRILLSVLRPTILQLLPDLMSDLEFDNLGYDGYLLMRNINKSIQISWIDAKHVFLNKFVLIYLVPNLILRSWRFSYPFMCVLLYLLDLDIIVSTTHTIVTPWSTMELAIK